MNLIEYLEESKSKASEELLEDFEVRNRIGEIDVIRGSEICRRRAWYDFNTPEKAEKVENTHKSEIIMEIGNSIEAFLVKDLRKTFRKATAIGEWQEPIWSRYAELITERKVMFAGTPDGWYQPKEEEPYKLLEIKSTSNTNFEKEKLMPTGITANGYLEQIKTYLGIAATRTRRVFEDIEKWDDIKEKWIRIESPRYDSATLIIVNRNNGESIIKEIDTGFESKEDAEDWIRRKTDEIVWPREPAKRPTGFSEQHPVCQSCKFFKACYEEWEPPTELDGQTIEYFEALTKEIQDGKERSKYASAKASNARNILVEEMTNRGINNFSLPSGKKGKINQVKRRGSINTDKMKADGIYDTYWDKGDGTYQQLRITSPKE